MDAADRLTAANAVERFIARFPFLKADVVRLAEEEGVSDEALDELGLHLLFGDVFNPYLLRLLESESTSSAMTEAFDFLEALASSKDERLTEVAAVTVCERLGDNDQVLRMAVKWMGPATRALSMGQEAGWGRRTMDDPIWRPETRA